MAVTALVSAIATGRYELAIMLPKNDVDAANIVALTITVTSMISLVTLSVVMIYNTEITLLLGNPEISNWLYIVPLTVFLTGVYQSLNYWSNRKKHYKRLSTSRVLQSGTGAGASLSMGGAGFSSGGLIIGQIVGQSVATLVFWKMIWSDDGYIFKNIQKSRMIVLMKQYSKHPTFLTFSYGLSMVYSQIPIFFIGRVFDLTLLGFYSLAIRFIYLPGSLIATSIGDVFRQKATEEYHLTGRFDLLLIKTVKHTAVLSVIPFLILFFVADDVFAFVFGEPWKVAGEYAQILTISAFFSFIISPIDKAALITNQMGYIVKWHTAKFVSYAMLFFIGYVVDLNVHGILYGLVFVNIVFYLIELYFEYSFSRGTRIR